ncbi:MAG: D-alanyl-D-alanine carboxypeptidase/D-alanyl-D-alanine-endopeptidase [Acidobacteria bacterium]|nr:D-alanyl-D-alanine carboxypeptidase/D-alanyl-D-alanine-endopeptidase [Acidobacteriota bacterium]
MKINIHSPYRNSKAHRESRRNRAHRLAIRGACMIALLWAVLMPIASAQRTSSAAPAGALAKQVEKLLDHPDVREAHWGVSVISMKRNAPLVSLNQNKLFIPASTAKLFPAAAALSLLGSDYRYKTSIHIYGTSKSIEKGDTSTQSKSRIRSELASEYVGDLILTGRGDPNLSGRVLPFNRETARDPAPTRIFRELALAVAARGIRTVTGDLIADDRYFVHEPYGYGWEYDDLMWLTAAPVSALAINDNVIYVSISPDAPGAPAMVQVQPMPGYYEIDNKVLTVGRTEPTPGGGVRRTRRSLGLGREPGSMRLQMWGEIPVGAAESSYAVSIEDPPRFTAEYLRQELAKAGVEIKGRVLVRRQEVSEVENIAGAPIQAPGSAAERTPAKKSGDGQAAPLILAEHESGPLAESLRVMLKVSQNLHAEMLLRTLGRERRGMGSAEAGIAAIDDFLAGNGIATDGLALRDGSGLSRQNMVSPAAMTALLKHMYQSEQGAAWTALLPEAGVDGTLRNRLRGRYTTARVWAKTGSLQGVATLAGYVANQSNDLLAFTIFANHYNEDEGSVMTVIDQIVTALARSR